MFDGHGCCGCGRRALIAGVAGVAGLFAAGAAEAAPVFKLHEVAPGIFVRHGVYQDASKANLDFIANTGFIIGERSVAVIDPGGSLPDGERLYASLRARTRLPVSHVILSHLHPDHFFGAEPFLAEKP
ncbi:MAG: MBL fold metallo-hydrolase, partial [Acetobacteraceae bacterium]